MYIITCQLHAYSMLFNSTIDDTHAKTRQSQLKPEKWYKLAELVYILQNWCTSFCASSKCNDLVNEKNASIFSLCNNLYLSV